MSRFLVLAFVSAATLVAADAADAVRAAAVGWTEAVVRQDKAALDRLLAEDLTFAHSNGRTVQSKAEYIAAVTGRTPGYEALPLSDLNVRIYGNTAVLTAHIATKNFGRDPFRVRTIQVFVAKSGRWQLAAFQSTRVSDATASGRQAR